MNNPIPFDLEKAKAGEPILWRGAPAQFIIHIPEAASPCRVVVMDIGGAIHACNEGGMVGTSCHISMAPKKRVVWVNFYNDGDCSVFETKAHANAVDGKLDRIACVRIEFTEGEGL